MIVTWLAIVSLTFAFNAGNFLSQPATARAVGDLTVDWGVPEGDPIFVIENAAPGDVQSRDVVITNSASTIRPVGVRGVLVSESGNLSTVLDLAVSLEGVDLYGGGSTTGAKTLAEFIAESAGLDGVPLDNINPGETKILTFTVTFVKDAGNEFQNTNAVFDLKIGIAIAIPDECRHIAFDGDPIFGTEGDDIINGTNVNNLIYGFEGNDYINGGNGDDCLVGGLGNDTVFGSNGDDVIFGNEGDDFLHGGNGHDVIFGNEGNDEIYGGNGDDFINTGSGNDKVNAGNGDDTVLAGEGNDVVDGGNGDDRIFGGPGNDILDGNNGHDYIEGNEGDDVMYGGNGHDTLLGGPGFDTADGQLGTDTCEAEVRQNCQL